MLHASITYSQRQGTLVLRMAQENMTSLSHRGQGGNLCTRHTWNGDCGADARVIANEWPESATLFTAQVDGRSITAQGQ
jgi:hypothetical protein